jgi:Fe-Mn family superoxide dismutase
MSDIELDRRLMLGLSLGATLAATAATAQTPASQTPTSPAAGFTAKPLPFDAKAIPGLSEKLLTSHHDNNYAGAVKRLGAIEAELAKLDPGTAPVFTINGLKREELIAWNSMILHELYFGGIGAPNRPGAQLSAAIERDFGSEARWRAEFTGTGKALGGGSGWVILAYSHRDKRLMNQWASDHTQQLAMSTPILVLDMYEHAYHMDFGSQAGAYVDAFMKVIDWRQANSLYAKAAA